MKKNKSKWKKPLNMLLASVLTVGLLPVTLAPQTVEAATLAPGGVSKDQFISHIDIERSAQEKSPNVFVLEDLAGNFDWTRNLAFGSATMADVAGGSINFHQATNVTNKLLFSTGKNSTSIPAPDVTTRAREIFSVQKSGGKGFPWEFSAHTGGDGAIYSDNQIITAFGTTAAKKKTITPNEKVTLPNILNASSTSDVWRLSINGHTQATYTASDNGHVADWSNTTVQTAGKEYFGWAENSAFDKGNIAEVLVFNRELTPTERHKVNSYLALKYGITLKKNDGTAADYFASNHDGTAGTTMWTVNNNMGYGNRITGIGRDDNGVLYQKQSKSQAEGANVTIALGDTVAASNEDNGNNITKDLSFFTFSDDGKTAQYDESDILEPNTNHKLKKLERIFKVEATNWEPADVTLKLDVTEDPVTPVYNYYLLTSSDGVSFDNPPVRYKLNEVEQKYEVTVNSDELQYFTFAKVYKEDLKTLVDGIPTTYVEDHYTADSWSAFDTAKKNAEDVLAEGTSSQKSIDEAGVALTAGEVGLTLKTPTTAALDVVAKIITIPFEYDAMLAASDVKDGFTVKFDGQDTPVDIKNIVFDAASKSLKITLEDAVALDNDSKLTVEYKATSKNINGPFDKEVGNFNVLAEDPFYAALTIGQPSGTIVSESKPTLSGKVEAGSTVDIVIKDKAGNPIANAGGAAIINGDTWTFTPSVELDNGEYTIEVTATKGGKTATKTKDLAVVDKTALQGEVDKAAGLISTDYTPESWAALQTKLAEANGALNNPNATAAEVENALTALTGAITALVKKEPELVTVGLDGNTVTLTFDQNVTAESAVGLTVKVGDQDVTLTANDIEVDPNDATKVIVTLPQNPNGQKVAVSYNPDNGGLKGTNGAPVQQFTDVEAVDPFTAALILTQPAGTTVSESKPTIAGKAEVGSIVTVVIKDKNGQPVANAGGTATVDNAGNWTFTPPVGLDNGEYTIEVTATKDNKSSTVSKELMVDNTNQPALTGLQLIGSNGSPVSVIPVSGNPNEYTASLTNSVYGVSLIPTALDPDAKIEVSVNNGAWQDVDNGAASDSLPLREGTNTIIVKVTDSKGNESLFTLSVTRASSGSTGGGGTTTPVTPKPEESGIEASVNGKDGTFATGNTSTSGDRTTTSVQVDLDKLAEELAKGNGQQLAIRSPKNGDVKVDGLTAGTIKQLADKGTSLEISNPLAIYPIPGGKMDLDGVSKQLGNTALGDIAVHIDIKRSSDALINSAKSKAAAGGYELLVDPVDLDLTFSHDGKTTRSDQLNGYAAKYIALPEGIDPNRITTGVIVNPDGSVFHVPTVVKKINSRYYAMINDLRSNGSYSVIWNPQDFIDVREHWGKADVNNITARLDLAGTGNNTFSPDRKVTRSEFSEIVVMGLGLMRQNAPQHNFPDVSGSAWYRDGVAIANEFDIVRGYSDGNFYGNQQITREQGIAMIARAYNLIEPQAELSQDRINALLAQYEDASSISAWARADVAQMIAAGIVQGNGPLLLSPKANMTRAEVTAMIARMLKTTNLIDK